MYPLKRMAAPACLLVLLFSCGTKQIAGTADHNTRHYIRPVEGKKAIQAYYVNEVVPITWKGGPSGNVAISLVDCCNYETYRGITLSVANSGNYSWKVPQDLPSGIYTIYITETGTPSSGWNYHVPLAIVNKDPLTTN